MNNLLVKMGAAPKKRSLLLLLLLAGLFNVASATTYYTATTGTTSVTSNTAASSGTFYSAPANGGTSYSNPTIGTGDIIIVVGTNALTLSTNSLTFSGLQIATGSTGSITFNIATTVNGDLTLNGGTATLGATVTVNGNLYMLNPTSGTTSLILGSYTINISGNFLGDVSGTQATGYVAGGNKTGQITFSATSNLGSGGTVTVSTSANSVATLKSGYNPQKLFANLTTGASPGAGSNVKIVITTAVQLSGNTVLPTNCRMMGGNPGLLDLNGFSLTCGYFQNSTNNNLLVRGGGTSSNGNVPAGNGNSLITINGSSTANVASAILIDNAVPGTTNLVNFKMNISGTYGFVTLNNNLSVNSNTVLTSGNIFLNGKTVTGSSFPTGSASSCFAEGVSGAIYGGTGGGSIIVSNPSTTAITVPLGYSSSATANTATYTPISFTNTTGASAATLTLGVAPLVTTNVATSTSCVPYQWTIAPSIATAITSDIKFGSTVNTTSGISTTSQLGVIESTNSTGYTAITDNIAYATAANTSTSPYTATFSSYTLPLNTNANTYVVGANGAVYPKPTITAIANQTAKPNVTITQFDIQGLTNVTTLSATNLPAGLSVTNTSTSAIGNGSGTITGKPTDANYTKYSTTISAVNVAGTASTSFTYSVGDNPVITSTTSSTGLLNSAYSYTITTQGNNANSFSATGLPSWASLDATTGIISGTPTVTGASTITITATNTGTTLSNAGTFTLTLTVVDVPTITSLSSTSGAVDAAQFTLTVNGTNFVNGTSIVNWTVGSKVTLLATTYVSATQLTAIVPDSLLAHTVSANTASVTVSNVVATSGTKTYTITVSTPTVSGLSPIASVAGATDTKVTITGSNFLSGVSAVTFNGSTTGVTTYFVSSTSLTATLSSSLLASASVNSIGVTNYGAGLTPASGATKTLTVYADGAVWSLTSGTPIVGASSTANTLSGSTGSTDIVPTNAASTNAIFSASGLKYIATTSNTLSPWPDDAGNVLNLAPINTVNTLFDGFTSSSNVLIPRYVQFKVTPTTGNNLNVRNISFYVTNNLSTYGGANTSVAYSFDGFSTTSGVVSLGSTGAISGSGGFYYFNYTTPIVVPDGKTMTVRLITYGKASGGYVSSGSVNYSNVVIGGTATASYPSPTITSQVGGTILKDAVDANNNLITYTSSSPIYTFTATNPPLASGQTITLSAVKLPSNYTFDASTGNITGSTPTTAGSIDSVILKADNGNLFPTYDTLIFNLNGIPVQPSVKSISPSTGVVDTTGFTLTVNGKNFANGKSAVTWNGIVLTTTYKADSILTAVVPASYVAASSVTDNTVTIGVNNTGATPPASTVNQIFTIINPTPSILALSPIGVVAGSAGFTLTLYGSNFTTSSKITWNGTQYVTTFVSSHQLTATINASDVASVGTASIGVTNVFPNSGSIASATNSFFIGNAVAAWSTTSKIPNLFGGIVADTAKLTGYVAGTATNGTISYGITSSTAYTGQGFSTGATNNTSTTDSTFVGLAAGPTTKGTIVATQSIDFKVTPGASKDMTISAISFPISVSTTLVYALGYSTDGVSFTKISTVTNTGAAGGTPTVVNTYDISVGSTNVTNFVFPTPITITNGNTLTLRLIIWRKAGSSGSSTVNLTPVFVGNTTPMPIPDAPAITTLAGDNAKVDVSFTAPAYTGLSAISSYKVYAYANGSNTAITSVSAPVSSLTLPYHILVTGLTNNTSYTFKVSATNGSGEGALSVISSSVIPSAITTWTVAGGWSNGDPDGGDQIAVINGNLTLTKALSATKLTIASGVTVATNGFNFSVSGDLINNGTISGTGILLLNTTSAESITGAGTVGNITINNTSGGVTVASGNALNITGVLTLKSGVLTTNGAVTFKSTSIANTGTLAALDGVINTGSISGKVTVERYIPAGFRGYRDLAPQVNNAGSIYNNWQEAGALTSGYGIFITGPSAKHADDGSFYGSSANSAQPAPAGSGLDYSINGNASAFTYSNSAGTFNWNYGGTGATTASASGNGAIAYGIANTTTTNLYPFTGYRVLVRGDRSFNLAKTPISNIYNYGLLMYTPTVLRSIGNVITGTVTYATSGVTNASVGSTYQSAGFGLNTTIATQKGFSMIANPYIAPVQWGTGTNTNDASSTVYGASSGINGTYWYLDPTHSATGTYGAYNALSGSVYPGNTTSAYIQPGQAFFVQTSAASPTVVFKETAKATSVAKVAVFGVTSPLSKIYFTLLKQDTGSSYIHADAAAIAFSTGFTNATYGPQDALKFGSSSDNLFIADKGNKLSIDGRLPATASDAISLGISSVTSTSYKLEIDATNYITNGFAPYLVDSYRGTSTALTTGVNEVKFTADAKVAASFENRFSLAFKPTTLAVNSVVASASLNNKIATISWNTVGEKSVSRFEVEKSIDAVSFTKIAQSTAKNTSFASYSATDNSVGTTSYYRIKVISEVGSVSYSNVVKLSTIDSKLSTYSLYPNPLKGSKVVNVSLSNVTAGKYTVSITNVLGQKVQVSAISHAGGNASYAITLNNTLAAGTYNVAIRETASGKIVNQTNLSVN